MPHLLFMRISLVLCLLFQAFAFFAQLSKQNPQVDKIDVLHYRFELRLSDTTETITARATINICFISNVKMFYFDLVSNEKGMLVKDVYSGTDQLIFNHEDNKLLIINDKWNKGDSAVISVEYFGIPPDGLIFSKNNYGDFTFFGDNWPDRAHNWLPVIDHPSDKATVEFIVELPEKYELVASGQLLNVSNIENKYVKYHYQSKIDLPTKVMVIGAADFKTKQYGVIDSVPVSSMIFQGAPDEGLDDYIYSVDALEYFTDLIGEYPYEKLVNVQSKTIYGGMENAGNIFYFENSIDGQKNYEDLVAHEIAHQWFGNSVTEKDWHHVWLSEGFATYLTSLYIEHKYGHEAFIKRMKNEKQTVLNSVRIKPGSVIDTLISDWKSLLSADTYQKAAWVLHMLRNKVGDIDFKTILRKFYSGYRNSNASTEDFVEIVNKVTGDDYSGFFRQWLYNKGIPELELKWKIINDKFYVQIHQDKELFDIDLPICLSQGNHKKTYILEIRKKNETFVFPVEKNNVLEKIGIEVDPDQIVLQLCKVEESDKIPDMIPLIREIELLKEGDLLFQDLDCGPLCEAIETVTEGYRGAHFSHVGIVIMDESLQLAVLEAIGEKVKISAVNDFLNRYYDSQNRPKVVVGRLKAGISIPGFQNNLKKYIGKTYDDIFDIEDEKYYCSELVYFLFSDEKKEKIFQLSPMTFKSKESGEYFPSWKEYYNKLKIRIPEGQPGINPGSISKSDKIDILYRFGDPEGWE